MCKSHCYTQSSACYPNTNDGGDEVGTPTTPQWLVIFSESITLESLEWKMKQLKDSNESTGRL